MTSSHLPGCNPDAVWCETVGPTRPLERRPTGPADDPLLDHVLSQRGAYVEDALVLLELVREQAGEAGLVN
jgi:hypothetical protein